MLRPHDIDDELRGVLRVDGEPWAAVGLFRERGRPPFDASDRALIASLSQPLAEAVRNHARAAVLPAPDADRATGPGLMLFRPDGELISANDEALAWLDELPAEPEPRAGLATRLPMVVSSTLMRARAIAQERDHRTARARMRSPATGRCSSATPRACARPTARWATSRSSSSPRRPRRSPRSSWPPTG